MISKKEKMIVKAINKSKGSPVDIESLHCYPYVSKVKGSNGRFPHGEIHAVSNSYSDEVWKFICTVEEFKQCVKELSEAKWMQAPVEELMLSARESAKDVNFQYHHFIKNDISEFPLEEADKSDAKEEAEIKSAKEKQIKVIAEFVDEVTSSARYQVAGNELLFKEMQEAGLLAEILLPLGK